MMPVDKFDTEAISRLAKGPRADVITHLPALLEWLQDINWPVAKPIAELLHGFSEELVAPLQSLLKGHDEVWKYWLVRALLVEGSPQLRLAMQDDILRIINTPTEGESKEEVDLVARDALFVLCYVDEPSRCDFNTAATIASLSPSLSSTIATSSLSGAATDATGLDELSAEQAKNKEQESKTDNRTDTLYPHVLSEGVGQSEEQ